MMKSLIPIIIIFSFLFAGPAYASYSYETQWTYTYLSLFSKRPKKTDRLEKQMANAVDFLNHQMNPHLGLRFELGEVEITPVGMGEKEFVFPVTVKLTKCESEPTFKMATKIKRLPEIYQSYNFDFMRQLGFDFVKYTKGHMIFNIPACGNMVP